MTELGPGMEVFGDYYLLGRVGLGGMAEIFRARRFQEPVEGSELGPFGRASRRRIYDAPIVVLKRLLVEQAKNPFFLDNFIMETDIARLFDHPNVVKTLQSGDVEGVFYLVMEYVSGVNLNVLLGKLASQRQRMDLQTALFIVHSAAAALDYTHNFRMPSGRRSHFVHRDLSPHNIFLGFGGKAKLGDFGVIHMDALEGSAEGAVVTGKLGYLSPEQVSAQELDERSDLFSLGIILYECLTGRRLFYARRGEKETEVMKRIREASVPSVRETAPDIPAALEDLVMFCLKARTSERIESAEALMNELSGFMTLDPLSAAEALAARLIDLFPQQHADFLRDLEHGLIRP
jgi:serine/threonine protein kinase